MTVSNTGETSMPTVVITVELFGTARIACGRREASLALPSSPTLAQMTKALAEACPELIGKAIAMNKSGLMKSYTFNLNGTAFLSDSTDQPLEIRDGDRLLLFSSQAGG